jgi:hypothetical protein
MDVEYGKFGVCNSFRSSFIAKVAQLVYRALYLLLRLRSVVGGSNPPLKQSF